MKMILILLACLVLLALTFVFVINVFGSAILRGPWPDLIQLFVVLCAEPKDYYDELVSEEIDISKTGFVGRFEFRNKYPGRHELGVFFPPDTESDVYYQKRYNLRTPVKVDFYVDDKLILSKIIEKRDHRAFLGRTYDGLHFMLYKCPEDLPRDKTIVCTLTILEGDGDFQKKYAPISFFIKKMSDL